MEGDMGGEKNSVLEIIVISAQKFYF